jgi:hypothetical protein
MTSQVSAIAARPETSLRKQGSLSQHRCIESALHTTNLISVILDRGASDTALRLLARNNFRLAQTHRQAVSPKRNQKVAFHVGLL